MKNRIFLIVTLLIYGITSAQLAQNLDLVSPFHEDLAAVKKDGKWAFVDREGTIVVSFRDDLVVRKVGSSQKAYPIFSEGKCLIRKMIKGNYLYGYINKKGETVIEPKFLNATNFLGDYAIIIKLENGTMGTNNVLGKRMVSQKLEEYTIDNSGETLKYLDNARNYVPPKGTIKPPPMFHSKFIGPNLIAVKNKAKKWDIYKL